mgnify:CR=1 FL=1
MTELQSNDVGIGAVQGGRPPSAQIHSFKGPDKTCTTDAERWVGAEERHFAALAHVEFYRPEAGDNKCGAIVADHLNF